VVAAVVAAVVPAPVPAPAAGAAASAAAIALVVIPGSIAILRANKHITITINLQFIIFFMSPPPISLLKFRIT
jgi:hypothetical protein